MGIDKYICFHQQYKNNVKIQTMSTILFTLSIGENYCASEMLQQFHRMAELQ